MEEWIIDQMYTVADGLATGAIQENLLELKPTIMKEWNEEKDALIDLFGRVRDDWIENLSGGIGANRFADAFLRELAGIAIPSKRIYGLGSGSKVDVLKNLQAMPVHQGLNLRFVEDRLATLKNVIEEPALDR